VREFEVGIDLGSHVLDVEIWDSMLIYAVERQFVCERPTVVRRVFSALLPGPWTVVRIDVAAVEGDPVAGSIARAGPVHLLEPVRYIVLVTA
jgi:hypothetical protein